MSNGQFAVTLDERAQIRDVYFPYVGLENHAVGHPFRFGIWINGMFGWLDQSWDIVMTYLPETLTSRYQIRKPAFGVELEVNDAIYHTQDVFLRKIKAANTSGQMKEIRLFFTQDFHIYGYEAGDTAFFEPSISAVIHYKGRRYFLVGGASGGRGFYQFAVGYKEVEGKEGTWRDCEDGQLSHNPVAQGAVDSAVSFQLQVPPGGYGIAHYWVAAGISLQQVRKLDAIVKDVGVEQMLLEVENYWSAWLSRLNLDLNVLPKDVARLYKRSLLMMRAHVDHGGGFLASLDSDIIGIHRDTYSYVWPRDGAMAALAFTSAGFTDVAERFFWFCNKVIGEDGFFRHKYLPDGSLGSTWHALVDAAGNLQLPIQEDETASVLYALWKCYEKAGNIEFITKVYDRLVVKAADFMMKHRDADTYLPKPTFDEWEEKVGVFTSTVAGVCAALDAAAKFAKVFYDSNRHETLSEAAQQTKKAMIKHLYDSELKRFIKGIYADGQKDTTIDSSISTIFTQEVLSAKDTMTKNTMDALIDNLWVKTHVGGLARYRNDHYRMVSLKTPGNPWFIATLRLARWHIAAATKLEELSRGMEYLRWAAKNALPSGALPEQLDPYTGKPISATPLLWSHAEFVLAVNEYISKHNEINWSQGAGA
ncbi:MAG: glycoside hydrolase family 15 protein [Candidatus Bathyarchaeota archaeon]|nr:glycoside hydrolase family 15 protein [Candidatus Bathyarchaeota archaeon]